MNGNGNEDRNPPEACGSDALRQGTSFRPNDVTRRIFGSDSAGASRFQGGFIQGSLPIGQTEIARFERQKIISAGILPAVPYLTTIDAQGTEHRVRFRGAVVEKHQKSDGYVPIITEGRKIGVAPASPWEYLRRLELQNELFGDDIRIIGLTRGNRFATTQPTLKGGEPTEIEIRDILAKAGWERVSIRLQDLPPMLMGSVWWHREEEVILLDARKPNFKKTDFGSLPIDLIIADLSPAMMELLQNAG